MYLLKKGTLKFSKLSKLKKKSALTTKKASICKAFYRLLNKQIIREKNPEYTLSLKFTSKKSSFSFTFNSFVLLKILLLLREV